LATGKELQSGVVPYTEAKIGPQLILGITGQPFYCSASQLCTVKGMFLTLATSQCSKRVTLNDNCQHKE